MVGRIAIWLIVIGTIIIGIGGFQLENHSQKEHKTLRKAKALTKVIKNPIQYKEWKPKSSDVIGILSIVRLKKELPIVEGTSEDQLAKGVGHYKTSGLPGHHDQIVLSGHRDTVFRDFGKIRIGDQLIVKMPYGSFTYIIKKTKIVDAGDRTIIHSTKPKEELVLTTCYPFHYVGNAPKRFIVYAYPVQK
jgi:sortase A